MIYHYISINRYWKGVNHNMDKLNCSDIKKLRSISYEFAYGIIHKKKMPEKGIIRKNEYISEALARFAGFAYLHGYMRDGIPIAPQTESELYKYLLTKPLSEWVKENWGADAALQLFSNTNTDIPPFVGIVDNKQNFVVLDAVYDYADSYDGLGENQQRDAYVTIKELAEKHNNPDLYVKARMYPIEHPIIEAYELDEFKRILYKECQSSVDSETIADTIYESIKGAGNIKKVCGYCGWTVFENQHRLSCIRNKCSKETDNFLNCKELTIDDINQSYRVKNGVQNFFCIPGKLELRIRDYAMEKGLITQMWPEYDKYDIKIVFPDNTEFWIDAKDIGKPFFLLDKIEENPPFLKK